MKTYLKKIVPALIVFGFIVTTASAQPPKHPPRETMQPLNSFNGKILSFTTNEDRIYDAFELDQNGTRNRVVFPKHLGKTLMATAKPGSVVTISGFMDYSPSGVQEIHMVSLTSGTNTVYDIKKEPVPPVAEEFITLESSIVDFKRNKEGQIDGLILKDKTILHFPKHIAYQLGSSMKPGDTIKATGYAERQDEGVVFAEPHRLVRAETISINGTNYLIR